MQLPENINRWKVRWGVASVLASIHILAFATLIPWLFSWTGLILMLAGFYIFGTLGINLCYHRLLTHHSFRCPQWLHKTLTILGLCNLQGSSIRWVAAHRLHHKHSDEEADPHSPLVDFIWSHIGWLITWNPESDSISGLNRYAGDLCRNKFHFWLEKKQRWLWIWGAHIIIFFGSGFLFGGLQLGLSWVVWGVLLRTVVVWHITWAINSLTHIWGYRNFNTSDNSRNNWLMGYLGMGEGWHNNHHAKQRSAAHGKNGGRSI